jgi:MFS family permease
MMTACGQPWWRQLNRQHWLVLAVATFSWLFDCLDQQIFNLSRDGAVDDLLLNKARATEFEAYTTSFLLVGWAVGGLIFGALGDRYGRVRMLAVTLLAYSVGTAVSALAWSFAGFCGCLFFTGLGVGGVFGLAVALVADALPDSARAPALGFLQSVATVGNLAAGFIGVGIGMLAARHLLPFGLRPWRALFLVGAAPALVCVAAIFRLREPERWLRLRSEGALRGVQFGSYRRLFTHPVWSRHAWFGLVFCSAGIVGLWGLGNFHPKIVRAIVEAHLASSHLTPEAMVSAKAYWSSVGLILQNVGAFFGITAFAQLAQSQGRRPALALALILSFLSTLLVFRCLRETSQMYWMLPIMGFGQFSVFGVYAVYLPELFPTSLRSTGTSFCYNMGRLVAATAPFTVGRITSHLGGDIEGFREAGMWVSLVLLLGLIVIPFLPETRNQPLPND